MQSSSLLILPLFWSIRSIIYTHGHPDHRGGAGSLIDDDPEIIAFAPINKPLGRTQELNDILAKRGARQFGYHLADDQMISQGLGPREGHTKGESYAFVPPTTLYTQSSVKRAIDGIDVEMVAAPGETDDTIIVWLPQHKVVCCGDNYYECWPNLAAIRGHQYRDVDAWITSLDRIIEKAPEALLPGHFSPIIGGDAVRERLTLYRAALDYVLDETLRLLNGGLTPHQIARQLALPEHLRDLDFLREFYGTLEWSVYGIFAGYIGWFDGNPTNLHPLADEDRARRLITAMGGAEHVEALIDEALDQRENQWALELTDYLLAINPADKDVRRRKAKALRAAAANEINATARNYYIASAAELEP